MKKIVVLILFFLLSSPMTGLSQWKFFEHRYKYKLNDVLKADRFIEKQGYWEGYSDGRLVGYVFLSKDWTGKLIGYSGKHMETLIGMDTSGILTGVKLIFHSEPIVLIGLKDENYLDFMKQYAGKDIKKNLLISTDISMDAITGATVTAVVQNAIILESARMVASKTGTMRVAVIEKEERGISKIYKPLKWKDLINSGSIKNISVSFADLGLKEKGEYLDLYFGLLTPPSIGKNVLGDKLYSEIINSLKKGETPIFIFSRGEGSFKGTGFARGGIFDRFNITQEENVYILRDIDYSSVTDIMAEGAPRMREGGIFIIRSDDFEQTMPFVFNLVLPYRIDGKREFKSFSQEYRLPEEFLQ